MTQEDIIVNYVDSIFRTSNPYYQYQVFEQLKPYPNSDMAQSNYKIVEQHRYIPEENTTVYQESTTVNTKELSVKARRFEFYTRLISLLPRSIHEDFKSEKREKKEDGDFIDSFLDKAGSILDKKEEDITESKPVEVGDINRLLLIDALTTGDKPRIRIIPMQGLAGRINPDNTLDPRKDLIALTYAAALLVRRIEEEGLTDKGVAMQNTRDLLDSLYTDPNIDYKTYN